MLDILETVARAGGAILNKYFRKIYYTSHKDTPRNIVTQADIESQKVIQDTILRLMTKKGYKKSDIGFIGEENLHSVKKHTFIIDPLDGTTNFSVGIPLFCIPIAYVKNGKTEASVVYVPTDDTMYVAQRGKGAYKKTHTQQEKLECVYKSIDKVVTSAHLSAHPHNKEKMLQVVGELQTATLGIRHIGVVALEQCWFAENILGIVINSRNYIWDTAATQLIIKEAGGTLVDFEGHELTYDFSKPMKSYNSLAIHPRNLSSILKRF